ncbi:MAG TPA: di-heme oxidoredictase family protein [Bryobacteraceae bacterium]|nr:di-heme oxidoredictase family protein [Bryobacteraceae bacterium]
MHRLWVTMLLAAGVVLVWPGATPAQIGSEKALPRHLRDDEEHELGLALLLKHGEAMFTAAWTVEDGAGRPLSKGTGAPLSDPSSPLVFPRNFNRVSGPDANSCAGCHGLPRVGGGGDLVTNVFVLGQRFDFATFDDAEGRATKGSFDELGRRTSLQTIANERATIGMFGSGYIEMLARQMTLDLRSIRDAINPGESRLLVSKGVQFGTLSRSLDGRWDVSRVEGLPEASLQVNGPGALPDLTIRPFHQAGRVVSLREFSNNAFNHHHGMQPTERFGEGTDPDGDGVASELTRADITAVSLYQATLPVPGRVIPRDRALEEAIQAGERRFSSIGCARCHIPAIPLTSPGRMYAEPGPFNPPGNANGSDGTPVTVDLSDERLPQPRLRPDRDGIVYVPAFTDFKLHDICSGPDDPNREPLDMQHAPGTESFFAGNGKFLSNRLWGAASEPPYFHHGRYTTMREAVLAHAGEALESRVAFQSLPSSEQNAVIEFLKSLRILPPGTPALVVDENGNPRPDLEKRETNVGTARKP